ncbi:MAG TPA: exodeoxyribonuclease V subunit beta [Syntrophorhabdaceae bacterium]|nr:exodeoxyribonuclease V subunit beta [Syntrophorhabdaceae bacterium]HPC66713.1 exodeoxyribonuclease V subunit beta [Syntrophorhabdaceae bacterium]HRV22284.1 exodeoxyribonuclease V subunit beta [Syntrophorhabdaceae bacterium]
MKAFDPVYTPLLNTKGLNLVEASAGTGKTYAIASIFVRLLIENNLKINEILVITYTNAATSELKERIRTRIKETIDAFTIGDSGDAFLKELIQKIGDIETAKKMLINAINDFDIAPIFTIHGFCLRVLRQYAFESLSLFDTELAEEDDDLMDEIVRDFWRINLLGESPFFLNYSLEKLKIEHLYTLAKKFNTNTSVIIEGDGLTDMGDIENESEIECLEAYKQAFKLWRESRDFIIDFLRNNKSLNGNIYRKKLDAIVDKIEVYFNSGYPLPLPEDLHYLCFDPPVKGALNKNGILPDHIFFKSCDILRKKANTLTEIYDKKIIGYRRLLLEYTKKELNKRKQNRNTRSFDDLLIDLYNAISEEGGKDLAELISRRYRAILIDEFQDTDPIQYEIINNVYKQGDTVVFIIGDPKQSIYSFRGADVFSYMKAARDAHVRWTLEKNYRSSERLIKAINTIFEGTQDPFLFNELQFIPVRSGDPDKQGDLKIRGKPDTSPLKIWFLERTEDKKFINAPEARNAIYNATADEIVRLVTMGDRGEIQIDDRPLSAKDIAILVRKNREAIQMQRALNRVNIHGVIYSSDSIFASSEAKDILYIISAINEPGDESRLKAAMITDIVGLKADELARMTEDERQWNEYVERYESYKNLWIRNGFINMARQLLSQEKVKARLLSMPQGERRLTNVLHLIELIHKACVRQRLSIEGAIKWLENKIEKEGASQAEEYQLRLETDEEAVKIVTIHRSKGLEYPVVFCPLTWGQTGSDKKDIVMFHDEKNNYSLKIDIKTNPEESSNKHMEIERLAEDIRILYVAMTRAKKRCYIAWGGINTSEGSGLGYILHSHNALSDGFSLEGMKRYIKNLSDNDIRSRLHELVRESDNTIEVIPLPAYEGKPYEYCSSREDTLSPRLFKGNIDKTWRVVSFSSLISTRQQIAELPDRDTGIRTHLIESIGVPTQRDDIFGFPSGTKAGSCLHEILEHIDFSLKDHDEAKTLIDEKLSQYGFERAWLDTIFNKIKDVLTAPLDACNETFTLSMIKKDQRLHELEFYLPLNLIKPKGLGKILGKHPGFTEDKNPEELIMNLGFSPVEGMMRGFMDMVFEYKGRFYIVDWKSNLLGDRIEDYNGETIKKVMADEYYFLQYHLYTVALNSLLSFRDRGYSYEKKFGGIFYIFIRGVWPDKGNDYGIFYDIPKKELIDELTAYLKGS